MAFYEKNFQTLFNKWAKHYIPVLLNGESAAFELKITKGTSLPFNVLKEHQAHALKMAKDGILIHKIADDSIGQKPFDCFALNKAGAFAVVMFRAKQREFIMIDIDVWLQEERVSDRKSLTEERAREIGIVCELSW